MGIEILQLPFASPETAIIFRTPSAIGPRGARRKRPHMGPTFRTLRFFDWMASRHTPATPHDVMAAFNVSRASAYRWLACYADARCLLWPPEKAHAKQPLSLPAHREGIPAYAGGALQ
jgi:hypothetical protein